MRLLLLIIFIVISSSLTAQEKKGVIKADMSFLSEYNFYQLSYEFNIKDKTSFEIGAGIGSASDVNLYGLSLQARFYLNEVAPVGFHLGPRIYAVYAEAKETDFAGIKDNTVGFEIDGIIGYQFLISDTVTVDPYIGGGLAVVENETQAGIVFGATIGIAF